MKTMKVSQIEKRMTSIPELNFHFSSGTAYPEDCIDWEVSDLGCRPMKTKEHFIEFFNEVLNRMEGLDAIEKEDPVWKSEYRRIKYLLKQVEESSVHDDLYFDWE